MIRVFRRAWRYAAALLGRRFEDAADPEIQIEQAIEEAKRQHASLVQQAAAVIGNQHEIELKLGRTMDRVEELRGSAGEALRLGDRARRGGDEGGASSYDEAARAFALALVTTEAEMRDLKTLHDRAIDGAVAAKDAVEQNAYLLRRRLGERTRLLSQLRQSKLQEQMNAALGTVTALAPETDVPSLDRVREKIESRYARALGTAELEAATVEVRALDLQRASLEADAERHLAVLRLTLDGAQSPNDATRTSGLES